MKKKTLGIFIDGAMIRAALVSREADQLIVEQVESFKLLEAIEQPKNLTADKLGKMDDPETPDFDNDPWNTDEFTPDSETPILQEEQTNLDIVREILNKMCPKGTNIAFNLCESHVFYKTIPTTHETRSKKIKEEIWDIFYEESNTKPHLENVGFLRQNSGSLLALIHNDPLIFSSLLFELRSISNIIPPKVKLIDSIEFALAHEIKKTLDIEKEENNLVVFFAKSFTKVFFMHGEKIITVLPAILEGAKSEKVCETTFSKILFEFSSGNIGVIGRVILMGEYEDSRAFEFFTKKFSTLPIQKFATGRVGVSPGIKNAEKLHEYTIPIVLAAKSLDNKTSAPYNMNFLPRRIQDKQAVYKIAWHGVVMLTIVFICAFLMTMQLVKNAQQISKTKTDINYLNMTEQQLAPVESESDSLLANISRLEKQTSLLDSLVKNTTRWSPVLETFSNAYSKIGRFSLKSLTSQAHDELIADAMMTKREQVAKLERAINNSMILNVTETQPDINNALNLQIQCKVGKGNPQEKEKTGQNKNETIN